MFFEERDIQLLTQLGFTRTQVLLYSKILELEETNAGTLAKKTNIPREAVYRTLAGLQKKGLVEKIIAIPYKYRGVPIEDGLQILMANHFQQFKEMEAKTKKLLRRMQGRQEVQSYQQEARFVIIEGKIRILQNMKHSHDNVQRSADIVSTLPRWLQIVQECFESYVKALDRKVKYRVILEKTKGEIVLPKNVAGLLEKPNFELRLNPTLLKVNLAIFDENEATFNCFASASLKDSPIIWTNNNGFICICQGYFDSIWNSAERFPLKKRE
jgi:sugar-specific transcriptional regulator TrmB